MYTCCTAEGVVSETTQAVRVAVPVAIIVVLLLILIIVVVIGIIYMARRRNDKWKGE